MRIVQKMKLALMRYVKALVQVKLKKCPASWQCTKKIFVSHCPKLSKFSGPCGQNAECRVLLNGSKRTAQCSCPTGLLGDPLKNCYKFNSTTPGPWNSCMFSIIVGRMIYVFSTSLLEFSFYRPSWIRWTSSSLSA